MFFFSSQIDIDISCTGVSGETAEDRLNAEMEFWKKIYPQYAKGIRVVTLNKKHALLLPHFDRPSKRDDDVVKAIETTLRKDYAAKGFYHDDVRWRNIGIRRDQEGLQAVVFDMESVKVLQEISLEQKPNGDWVREKICDLRKRM